jgi:hypothetical protein
MGWERGYYYRVRKVNGRVVREYVGAGRAAVLIAQLDELDREKRAIARAQQKAARASLDALDAPFAKLNEIANLLARAALLAAGYRQHKRGEWRKKRVNKDEETS